MISNLRFPRFYRFAALCLLMLLGLMFPVFAQDVEPDSAGSGGWQVIKRSDQSVSAFIKGAIGDVVSGSLAFSDFEPFCPPDAAAAMGLATVNGPSGAAWFLHAGQRLHLKAPNQVVYSYESLARLGWAVGIPRASAKNYSAHLYFGDTAQSPADLDDILRQAVAEAADADAWLVAGQVDFSEIQGRYLHKSPISASANGASPKIQKTPVDKSGPGLIVALIVKKSASSNAARSLREKCFDADAPDGELLIKTHYAIFRAPAPAMDPAKTPGSIWRVTTRAKMPQIEEVAQALPGALVSRANLLVWSIRSVQEYNLYKEPDLVDVTMLDPTILTDQRFATTNNPFGIALYPKPRFLLREPVAKAVLHVNERLKAQGYRLKLFDAYRPLSVTQKLWHMYRNMEVSSDTERRYLAAPNVGSRHNRGAAVDCTMTDMNGDYVEMPSDYLTFDSTANLDSKDMTSTARKNLAILSKAMQAEGFTTIRDEWWHFDAANWMNYQVVDIPFWPEAEAEDRVAERTNGLLAELAQAPQPDELPELPDEPEMAASNNSLESLKPPDLPSVGTLPSSNAPAVGATQPPASKPTQTAAPQNFDPVPLPELEEQSGKIGSNVLGFLQEKTGKIYGLPLVLGSFAGMAVLAGMTVAMLFRAGRAAGSKKR